MPDRLQEIRARLDAATPGPHGPHRDYMALIAHAPADIAWLLEEVAIRDAQQPGNHHCYCCRCEWERGNPPIACDCDECRRRKGKEPLR